MANGKGPHRLLQIISSNKCATLTLALVLFLLLNPLLSCWSEGLNRYLLVIFYVVSVFAPYFVSSSRKVLYLTIIPGGIFLLPKMLQVFFDHFNDPMNETLGLPGTAMLLLIIFEVLLVCCVMFYSLYTTHPKEPIFGCVLTYLLLAIVFGDLYFLMSRLLPGSFAFQETAFTPELNDMWYFSFTTLTTSGFGDIVATHPFTRQLAGLEAVCGVLYVALFIGRQIGLMTNTTRMERNQPVPSLGKDGDNEVV